MSTALLTVGEDRPMTAPQKPVSKRLRYEILRRDDHTCRYCGRRAPDVALTVDHVIPTALGGRTEAENLVTACGDCNAGKSSIAPDSPIVASVSEDALRWAEAARAAAAELVLDVSARAEYADAFKDAWDRWTYSGGDPIPLPDGWRASLGEFHAAGLPIAVIVEAVDITMARPRKDDWRYFCGVTWRKVDELIARTGEITREGGP